MALPARKTYNPQKSVQIAGLSRGRHAGAPARDRGSGAGPMAEDRAIAFVRTKDPDFVHVRREDCSARA
jgi:hypothetical protein